MRAVYLKDKNGNKLVSVPYYRVGDLFLTTIATNPSSYLGGKWELFGPGRCLVCVDTSQTEFNSVKKIGGSNTHSLSKSELPNFGGNLVFHGSGANATVLETVTGDFSRANVKNQYIGGTPISGAGSTGIAVLNVGNNQPHNNLQPFITCYIWIRTA